jgi:hypothetical protein
MTLSSLAPEAPATVLKKRNAGFKGLGKDAKYAKELYR